MGRPREPESEISEAAIYKRNQRDGKTGSKCANCGSTSDLVIDHKNGEKRDNRGGNLRTLCRSCHIRKHKEVAVKGGKAS